jgi:hypothetical protein
MPKSFAGYLAQAQRHWEGGHPRDAGRVIYETLPKGKRPAWAARVLELVRDLAPGSPEIDRVLAVARDPARWQEAKEAFHAVREVRQRTEDPLPESVLSLAEKVAKVTYNSSGGPTPFERDAGWRVADDLRTVISRAGDTAQKLEEQAWSVLSGA